MLAARVACLVVLVAGIGPCVVGCHSDVAENGPAVAGAGSGGAPSDAGAASAGMPGVTAGAPAGGALANGGTAATTAGAASTAGATGTAGAPTTMECTPVGEMSIGVAWGAINSQPAAFYASPQARSLAENILYYQNADHGWPKNVDMTTRTPAKAKSTIDNRGTTTEIEYLARVFGATGCSQYHDGATSGVEGAADRAVRKRRLAAVPHRFNRLSNAHHLQR